LRPPPGTTSFFAPLLAALGAWERDKTMEERAAKVMRMAIAIGKVGPSVSWK
jgi:hypothetical protein